MVVLPFGRPDERRPAALHVERCDLVVTGIYLAGVGINVMTHRDVMYPIYLRWPVPPPLALAIGVILIVAGFRLHRDKA